MDFVVKDRSCLTATTAQILNRLAWRHEPSPAHHPKALLVLQLAHDLDHEILVGGPAHQFAPVIGPIGEQELEPGPVPAHDELDDVPRHAGRVPRPQKPTKTVALPAGPPTSSVCAPRSFRVADSVPLRTTASERLRWALAKQRAISGCKPAKMTETYGQCG